ncbi:hypothetical protein [Microbacterium sp. GXF0217]
MSNQYPPPFPIPITPDDADAEAPVTREVDGDEILDEDIDPNRVDSAEADRLAAGGTEEEDL